MTGSPALASHDAALHGRSVLVVEDETLVSFLIEDMLAELGCCDVRHASDLAQALAQLAAHRPDAVVLDVNIAGEAVYPLAERLAAEGTPFIFATGYGRHGIPPQWASRPVIQKPFDLHTLAVALATALSAAAPLR